jgi:PAS domain S-box-containing protein
MKLRSHLIMLVSGAIAPLLLVAVAAGIHLVRHERETIERDAIGRTRAAMTAVDAELRGTIATMKALASSRHLQEGNFRAFHQEARRVLASQPYWLNVGLVSAENARLVDALSPFREPAPSARERARDDVPRSGGVAIGDVAVGGPAETPSIWIGLPVEQPGAVRYVLTVPVRLELFAGVLRAQKLPAEWVIVVADRQRRFIARIPPRPPGEPISASFREALERAPEGFFRGRTVEGFQTYTPYVTSALSGWVLGIAVPASVVNAGAMRLAATLTGGVVIALAVAWWLAWVMAKRIAGPIGALATSTKAMEPGGELALRAPGRIDEIVQLHRALGLAAAHVRERQDLVEREKEALRASEERLKRRTDELQTMLDIIPVGVAISHDSKGDRISGNASFERILGLRQGQNASVTGPGREQLPYRCVRDGKEIPGQELPMQIASRTGRDVRDVEFDVALAGGEVIHLMVSAAPLFDEQGRVRGAIGAHIDVTRLKQAEAALKAANQAKDEFLAMLGHELRNPLGAIASAASLLTVAGGLEQAAERARAVIGRQVQHLSRLVDDLLDVSRVTSGKVVLLRRPVDLADLAASAVAGWRAAGRLDRHRVSVTAAPVWVDADETRIEQVLSNLLSNALKYTPAGGAVTIRVGAEGDTALLQVEDTGVGMPPALVDRVFDLFVQGERTLERAQGGLGIGLTLVKMLVELHGGAVEAQSAGHGRGAVFTVRLPRISRPSPGRAVAPRAPAEGARHRILVIEDNADTREMLRVQLELAGHEVHEAAEGQTGVEAAATLVPDVALVDVGLPGMDGYDVARRIRAGRAGKSVRLVALTGYGQAEDRRRALEAGFDAHVTKPVLPERLAEIIGGSRPDRVPP